MNQPFREFHIALLPGDGIGKEVIRAGLSVLRAVEQALNNVRFHCQEYAVGAGEFLRTGDPFPESAFAACQTADAVLLGAMGIPEVRWPDGREIAPQLDLREKLELYAGIRPIHLYHPADTPLRGYQSGDIDFLIVRENTEGLFYGRQAPILSTDNEVRDVLRISRQASERLFRAAFAEARKRRGLVTLVDKANVLPSMVFFREVFDQVAGEFLDVTAERVYVDAAALYLVKDARRFDVMVTENMFGDILSDLAAGLVGGMGMAPSADIGDQAAVFQPSHGSAPDIAGKGTANPIATILSVALMLDWLGDEQTQSGAQSIRAAVETVFADPENRTPDMGGSLGTEEITSRVIEALPKIVQTVSQP